MGVSNVCVALEDYEPFLFIPIPHQFYTNLSSGKFLLRYSEGKYTPRWAKILRTGRKMLNMLQVNTSEVVNFNYVCKVLETKWENSLVAFVVLDQGGRYGVVNIHVGTPNSKAMRGGDERMNII